MWEYTSDAELQRQRVEWHDFKSIVSAVRKVFEVEKDKADKAAAAAAKPSSGDRGGVRKLDQAFKDTEGERKRRVKAKQEEWDRRDADIDKRVKQAHDVLAPRQGEVAERRRGAGRRLGVEAQGKAQKPGSR